MPPLMRIYQNPIVLLALQTLLAVLISACSAETAPEPEIQGMMNSAIPSIVLETDPEIQIINFSSHPTEEFVRWANSASEEESQRKWTGTGCGFKEEPIPLRNSPSALKLGW